MNPFVKIIGRNIVGIDYVIRVYKYVLATYKKNISFGNKGYESTGIHVATGHIPNRKNYEDGIVIVDYDDESHKLWRAQEFSLFFQNINLLKRPILDLGCGDGSFSAYSSIK